MGTVENSYRYKMTDDRRQSAVSQFFYDANAGTVMGRTGRSWAKILLFYTIYYSFLALIFFCSIWIMKAISKPGEASQGAPTLSRVEQPGMTVYPHQDNRDDKDGFEYPVCIGANFQEFKGTRYYKGLETFFNNYNNANISQHVSPDFQYLLNDKWKTVVEDLYEKNSTLAILSLNKVLNFKLLGRDRLPTEPCEGENVCEPAFQHKAATAKAKFDGNSLYFNCIPLDDQGDFSLTDNDITIDLANPSEPGRIAAVDYDQAKPYDSTNKAPNHRLADYVKPFVAFKIQLGSDTKDETKIRFRCLPIAGNINNSYQSAETLKKFGKNGLGMLEFGYNFRTGTESCKDL